MFLWCVVCFIMLWVCVGWCWCFLGLICFFWRCCSGIVWSSGLLLCLWCVVCWWSWFCCGCWWLGFLLVVCVSFFWDGFWFVYCGWNFLVFCVCIVLVLLFGLWFMLWMGCWLFCCLLLCWFVWSWCCVWLLFLLFLLVCGVCVDMRLVCGSWYRWGLFSWMWRWMVFWYWSVLFVFWVGFWWLYLRLIDDCSLLWVFFGWWVRSGCGFGGVVRGICLKGWGVIGGLIVLLCV